MCSSPDTRSAMEAGVDLGRQCPLGPPLRGHTGSSPGTATSLGSAGRCVCGGTIRRAGGTLHTQVPKPCNVRPQLDFPSRAGACSRHWKGLVVFEAEEKLQRKKS